MIAVILSILFPGLGQIYLGKTWRGILMILLGISPLYPVSLVWSIVDIIRLNKTGEIPVFDKRAALWVVIAVPLFFFLLGLGIKVSAGKFRQARRPRMTWQEGAEIAAAIQAFKEQTGALPDSIGSLIAMRPPRAGWRTDAWGNDYLYSPHDDGTYTLSSAGADGKQNTPDDLSF